MLTRAACEAARQDVQELGVGSALALAGVDVVYARCGA
jgi:hypothetical protein